MKQFVTRLRLAILLARRGWLKLVLLSLLLAISMVIFLLVSELSRISTTGLDDAISNDIGESGLYYVDLSTTFGLTDGEITAEIATATGPYRSRDLRIVDVYPITPAECPPFDELGDRGFNLLREQDETTVSLPFGTDLPDGTRFCFSGQIIPGDALYVPSSGEARNWTNGLWQGLFIRPEYQRLADIATSGRVRRRYLVPTGSLDDQTDQIRGAVLAAVEPLAARFGVDSLSNVSVGRNDGGEEIRAASEGTKLVYGAIGWGVLALGALGVATAQIITTRGRSWFYGLSRAIGATRTDVAQLIALDIALIVMGGAGAAIVISAVAQPAVSDFARNAFDADVDLLQPSGVLQLLVGALVVLLLAAVPPVAIAVRQDPVDVLEPKQG